MGPQKDHNIHAEKSLASFSHQLKLGGVNVVAVGTDGAQEDDLVHMSSKPEYAVRVKSLLSPEEAEKVSKVICHGMYRDAVPISNARDGLCRERNVFLLCPSIVGSCERPHPSQTRFIPVSRNRGIVICQLYTQCVSATNESAV